VPASKKLDDGRQFNVGDSVTVSLSSGSVEDLLLVIYRIDLWNTIEFFGVIDRLP
jgi:hypothetical protein